MHVQQLEHYNIRTPDMESTVRFFTEALRMRHVTPPKQSVVGLAAWIVDERGIAVVHITSPNAEEGRNLDNYYGKKSPTILGQTGGPIDHVAFEAHDFSGYCEHFTKLGIGHVTRHVATANLQQIFLTDPNGITIEMNFHSD